MKERTLVLVVAGVQFVNVLDFVMVMPLGPDFAAGLGIETSHIGIVGGSYTAAAAVAGLAGATFLDRFDRRKALAVAMLGLVVGTVLGGFATGLVSLLLARVLAGAFGGPATALSLAIVSDVVPPDRRGRALGVVMTAFSVASTLGVPVGLELARLFGWRAPFFAVGALGLVFTAVAVRLLPSLTSHLNRDPTPSRDGRLFDGLTALTLLNTALVMGSVFAIVPNISAFLQHNLGYPRDHLGVLYLVGGIASFLATRLIGTLVDRFGATKLVAFGTLVYASALYLGFVHPLDVHHVIYVFTLLMLSASLRGVPLNTLATRVPHRSQRARFMSAQSAVQHLSSSAGALITSLWLDAEPSGKLVGMASVSLTAIGFALFVPVLSYAIERAVKRREAERAAPPAPAT
jgi:predicted MFS family arabinose efflux permease